MLGGSSVWEFLQLIEIKDLLIVPSSCHFHGMMEYWNNVLKKYNLFKQKIYCHGKHVSLFQRPRGSMKLLGLGFIIVFFFATTGPLSADKVYTWTDKDGNLHITDQPPPEGANVRNVIKYKPQSEKEVQEFKVAFSYL